MSRESDLTTLVGQAARAYQSGQKFFVARFKLGAWGQPNHGELPTWGESLEAVEAAGWVLDRWATSSDNAGGLNAFPVFRRGAPPVPTQSAPGWPTPQDRP